MKIPIGSGSRNISDHLCRAIMVGPMEEVEAKSNEFNFNDITVKMVWKQVEKIIVDNTSHPLNTTKIEIVGFIHIVVFKGFLK